ncbi:MAG: HXXEE domain-containing protein [Prevotella sp.]
MALDYTLLLLPLLFVVHDMEEMTKREKWIQLHGDSVKSRFPKMRKAIDLLSGVSSTTFSIMVAEELVIILVAVVACWFYASFHILWASLLGAFTLHLLIHIFQALILGGYIPGLITSVMLFPPACFIILMQCDAYPWTTLSGLSLLCLLFAAINLSAMFYMATHFFKSSKT